MNKPAELVRGAARALGVEVTSAVTARQFRDLDADAHATIDAVKPFTMTSPQRVAAVIEATRYVRRFGVPGDLVECGVWRGGSSLAIARTLAETGSADRDLYLFDTFEGMVPPTDADADLEGTTAAAHFRRFARRGGGSEWCYASIDEVTATMARSTYPADRIHLVKGPVEETLPSWAPERIALLRLDTDWYESTRHELETLVPRVSPYGVVIVDDYGMWAGARRAVDEFLDRLDTPIFLQRIDGTARSFVVPPRGRSTDAVVEGGLV